MADPAYFDVRYAINPYMHDQNGKLHTPDIHKATKQWHQLKQVYHDLGFDVFSLSGKPHLPDWVFSANTFLSTMMDGTVHYILSNMANAQRRDEVGLVKTWLQQFGHGFIEVKGNFEGMGDAIVVYETHDLFLGRGDRTDAGVGKQLAPYFSQVIELDLNDPCFYHLDTCLSILNHEQAIWVPEAFSIEGQMQLKNYFQQLIPIDRERALLFFSANCHCPDGKNIIVQRGGLNGVAGLNDFNLIEVDTSEFMLAGGSVFCMKNQFFQ